MKKDVLEYKGYYGVVHYSPADECLYGEISGISDSVSFEGYSAKDIKGNFKEAVDDYIETCNEVGKEPLKSAKGSFNIRLGEETHLKALIKANIEGKSLNQVVKDAVEKDLKSIQLP